MSRRYRTTDMNETPNRPDTTTFYTMYVVRDDGQRQFLTDRAYSGASARGKWATLPNAHLFQTPAQAQSCAGNISRRSPGARVPRVVPVLVTRRIPG